MFSRLNIMLRRFHTDIYGGITALTVMVFIIMIVSVGMAVDFMRHETYRAELQDALDRGVLAAAAFDQTQDAEATVHAYLKSTNFVKHCYTLAPVVPDNSSGQKKITATANCTMNTFFLKMVGMPTLDVFARGTAVEGATAIEVSLVLDISTSMVLPGWNETGDTRLLKVKNSATNFVDQLFNNTRQDRISMSLIPFGGHVNVGPTAFQHLNDTRLHSHSHCIDFIEADFTYVSRGNGAQYAHPQSTGSDLPPSYSRSQMQQFNRTSYWNPDTGTHDLHAPVDSTEVDFGWCPSDTQAIEYFSTDQERLKQRIWDLTTHEATGSHYGAKWGAMLLDPSVYDDGLTSALITAGEVNNLQSELPRPYTDEGAQKFLIFMTDGATSIQDRILPEHYDEQAERDERAISVVNQMGIFRPSDLNGDTIEIGQTTIAGPNTQDRAEASRDSARIAFKNVCETAKDNGVIIFTIGVDINQDPATLNAYRAGMNERAHEDLAACASSPNNFLLATGDDLGVAFSAIASTIQKLKLTN